MNQPVGEDPPQIAFRDSLDDFYYAYAMIVKEPNSFNCDSHEITLDRLWNFFCAYKVEFSSFLLDPALTLDKSLYGEDFKEVLPGISRLPNNVHILFWIEAISRHDFLFGKRVLMGNSITTYLRNPVAIFPYFINGNGDTIPEFRQVEKYDYDDMMNVRPYFEQDDYDFKIDSTLNIYRERFNKTLIVEPTNLNWFTFEGQFFDNKFKTAKPLPDSTLH